MAAFELKDARGVIPAMLTPFGRDELPDLKAARALAAHLCGLGAGGLYLTGSSGEGFLMSAGERKAVVEAVIDEVGDRVPVIVHVGAISTLLSEDLARHAGLAGAAAVSSVPPIYFPFSEDEICGYYAQIAQAARVPMVIYNVPLAGLVGFETIVRLGRLPGVEGIKYTASTHFDFIRIRETLGEAFAIYSGSDEMALSGLAFGCRGLIGSTFNVLLPLFRSLYRHWEAGRIQEARELQQTANRFVFVFLKHGLIPSLKQTLSFAGVEAGTARRPFLQPTPERLERLVRDLRFLREELGNCGLPFMEGLPKR